MLGAVEIGRDLDVIRRKLRRRCRRMDGFRGDSTVDRIIDMVVAPLLLDADDETIRDVGDDLLSVFSRPPNIPSQPGDSWKPKDGHTHSQEVGGLQ